MLNAKNNEKEAEVIAMAGQLGAVTIATNMAGRGTDIKLGPGVEQLGGYLSWEPKNMSQEELMSS